MVPVPALREVEMPLIVPVMLEPDTPATRNKLAVGCVMLISAPMLRVLLAHNTTFDDEALIVATPMVEVPVAGSEEFHATPVAEILIVSGSSSQLPVAPEGAKASTIAPST